MLSSQEPSLNYICGDPFPSKITFTGSGDQSFAGTSIQPTTVKLGRLSWSVDPSQFNKHFPLLLLLLFPWHEDTCRATFRKNIQERILLFIDIGHDNCIILHLKLETLMLRQLKAIIMKSSSNRENADNIMTSVGGSRTQNSPSGLVRVLQKLFLSMNGG